MVSAPVLNTLSQQTGGDSLTQTALQQYEPVVVGSPQWHDELAGALKNIAGGSPLTGQTGISDDWPLPSGNNGYRFRPRTRQSVSDYGEPETGWSRTGGQPFVCRTV
ncbi:hypothetical protein DMI60_26370 [Escherichia coli]|nr:hypothetical protein [Escherichia coli]NYY75586.1 hypothetical protein [Escherichia coli]NYY77957.1 hypothetical protein [Escherichia coli]